MQALGQLLSELANAWFPQRCLLCLSTCRGDFCAVCQPLLDQADQLRCLRCPRCGMLERPGQSKPGLTGYRIHTCDHQSSPWDHLWIGMDYQVPIDGLLMLGKFARDANACRALGRWLAGRLGNFEAFLHQAALPVLVPMPSTPSRLRQRGYNPVEQIARGWRMKIKALGLAPPAIACDLLLRSERGPSQSRRNAKQRKLANEMPEAEASRAQEGKADIYRAGFYVNSERIAAYARSSRMVLLDDVMTTGATLKAACNVLRQSVPQPVDIVVLMRR